MIITRCQYVFVEIKIRGEGWPRKMTKNSIWFFFLAYGSLFFASIYIFEENMIGKTITWFQCVSMELDHKVFNFHINIDLFMFMFNIDRTFIKKNEKVFLQLYYFLRIKLLEITSHSVIWKRLAPWYCIMHSCNQYYTFLFN